MKQQTFDYGGDQSPPIDEKVHDEVEARWDEGLSASTREFVRAKTDEIHGQMMRTAEGIIRIGQNLLAVKARLNHGQFLPWLKAEFDMSQSTASRLMQSAARFKDKFVTVTNLSPAIIYALAAPSTSDQVVDKVLTGQVEASLSAIKAEKKRADDAEQARVVVESQLQQLRTEVATLQHQLEERPPVVEKTVENSETEAALSRLKQEFAEKERQLKQKTERVAVLSAELQKHAHRDEQETYREQVRYKWRRACEAFHQGIKEGLACMVTPLDAGSAFEADDWARLDEVRAALNRMLEELCRLQEGGHIIEADR